VEPQGAVSVTDVTKPTATGATFHLTFGDLALLNGKNYLGKWSLTITDSVSDNIAGTLNAWSLNPLSITADPQALTSVFSIDDGGSGYKAGDILTLLGGTY